MMARTNIALIGMMGCKKSTVAAYLAQQLGMQVLDTDEMFVTQNHMTINRAFETFGEPYFREKESEIIRGLATYTNSVLSLGGGAVLSSDNMVSIAQHSKVFWLDSASANIFDRIKGTTNRPLLAGNMTIGYIDQLRIAREPFYRAYADKIIDADREIDAIIEEIICQSALIC